MSRSLAILLVTIGMFGCHGQSGNPFMRTTVPPPATGAGAPTDPYYNNSGPAQQPPAVVVPPNAPMPGPAAVTPVVPPPDKRYSAPGGYNFPQGSINHRKAVDPAPNDYRAGTSAIARAARPRSRISASAPAATAIAVEQTPENTPLDEPSGNTLVASGYTAEESTADAAWVRNQSHLKDTKTADTAGGESDSKSLESSVVENESAGTPDLAVTATEPSSRASATGGATLRIVTSEPVTDESAEQPKERTLAATPSTSPFKPADPRGTTLSVAPPHAETKSSPAPGHLTATAGGSHRGDGHSSSRFYFDRTRPAPRTDAQPAAFKGETGSVMFAGGVASNTGISSGPDGAPAYSHHTNYSWLRGRLEYSTAARRWKLRYIPIDGQTDSFGGSVVLSASPLLESLRHGDMVTIEGTIGKNPADHGGFSPLFELQSLKPQQ